MADSKFESPFLVSELRPQNVTGNSGKFYQLSAASASPTVIVGRDELGRPIEDTVPTVYFRRFVMLDGCVNKVPLRTCSEFKMEPEAVQYEQQVTTDLVRAGCMPIDACPYTFKFSFITNGPLAKIPEGESDCGGAPDGCIHMKKLMVQRQAAALARHKADQARVETMRTEEIEKMRQGIVDGVGEAIARNMVPPTPNKGRLQNHKSDQE